ncbi:hypothetical protein [Delftia sp. PE138]|uniref:hypothetical protein n=1 Tax=Delftia sp. PE138 TaxID=1812483 RepID=UPI001BAEFDAE|nr:hypothetical protein [Delftia sp. PE138]MBS3723041.1 hypothetical protein [Delftia sp. PE138]
MKNITQIKRLIKTASKEANTLTISALFLIGFKILILNKFPQLFPGAYDIGVIFEGVLASIVASYIFYLFVVHIKEKSDNEILKPYITSHATKIVIDSSTQISNISQHSGVMLDAENLDAQHLENALSNLHPYGAAPLVISPNTGEHASWMQYFHYYKESNRRQIRKLLDQIRFLDASLVSDLTKIDDCNHFIAMDILITAHIGNENLSTLAESMHEYHLLCQALNKHFIKLGLSE